jgi:hypothetical protein
MGCLPHVEVVDSLPAEAGTEEICSVFGLGGLLMMIEHG